MDEEIFQLLGLNSNRCIEIIEELGALSLGK